ncbi:MAG: exonuclease domain-containing protein [Campylobacterales bacterium]
MFATLNRNRQRRKLKDEAYAFLFEPYDGDEVVVFDTETTGLDPRRDEIVSIGAVKVKGNRILTSETFEVYLKTERPIPKKSIEVHGIRPCDLEHAVAPREGINAFLKFIGPRPLAGYYLEFDVAMNFKNALIPSRGATACSRSHGRMPCTSMLWVARHGQTQRRQRCDHDGDDLFETKKYVASAEGLRRYGRAESVGVLQCHSGERR